MLLSFMQGEIVQVWAENETNVVLSHTSMFPTLAELLAGIERTLVNHIGKDSLLPVAHPQNYNGMMAKKYTAKNFQDAGGKDQFQ